MNRRGLVCRMRSQLRNVIVRRDQPSPARSSRSRRSGAVLAGEEAIVYRQVKGNKPTVSILVPTSTEARILLVDLIEEVLQDQHVSYIACLPLPYGPACLKLA